MEYYKTLGSLERNKNALHSFWEYLKSVEMTGFDFIKDRPVTEIYKRCCRQFENNSFEFMQNIVMNDLEVDDDMIKRVGETYAYNAPQLYKDYVQYCINNKYIDRQERKTFDNTVSQIGRNNKGYCWKFTKDTIKDFLQYNEYWVEPDACDIEDTDDEIDGDIDDNH